MVPYLGRFEMKINSSAGVYNLLIRFVRPEDAGAYICMDYGGSKETSSAELIVLGLCVPSPSGRVEI